MCRQNFVVAATVAAAYGKDGQQYSLCEYILRETEMLHGKVRRYTSPDEHAFYPGQQACKWFLGLGRVSVTPL
jgi:hypothetical protein